MDRANQVSEPALASSARPAASARRSARAGLRLVAGGLRLAEGVAAPDPQWDTAFADLLGWLDIPLDPVPAAQMGGLRKIAGWARGGAGGETAPQFAPWQPFSPVALQHGANADLPRAEWVASYLFDHATGSAPRAEALDLMLVSPHPALCSAEEAGAVPLPRPGVTEAMIRAARAEGRSRVAIIVAASQRNAMARQLLLIDRELTRDGLELEVLPIEQALGGLTVARPRWDALIVMPDLRSIVFALLAEASGIRAPWPMLWHSAQGLVLAASEALVEAGARLPLDAPVLVQALALTLHYAGMTPAARRLSEAAVRLRDNGVFTRSRGSAAPYASTRSDAEFVAMIRDGLGHGSRPVPHWRALGDIANRGTGRDEMRLYIVASNSSSPSSS